LLPAPLRGIVQAGEQCDDGNRVNNDGCSAACPRTSAYRAADDLDHPGSNPVIP
jgi:cysteine-rich repeat protein